MTATLTLVFVVLGCTATDDVPTIEKRAQEVNKAVMCPVCPGESIDQSQNPLAVQMRAIVMEKLEGGWTEEQIREFFVVRYGPSVLLEPPTRGISLLVWVVPSLGVALAALVLYLAVRRMARQSEVTRGDPLDDIELSDQERSDYVRQIEAALASEEGPGGQERALPSSELRGPPT